MRIQRLLVDNWRQVKSVDIQVPENSRLICLIGENGAGKSSLLEIISECLLALGIDQGEIPPRGHHLNEPHKVRLEMDFSDQLHEITTLLSDFGINSSSYGFGSWSDWAGKATFCSFYSDSTQIQRRALLLDDHGPEHDALAEFQNLFHNLADRNFLRHLHLDSNRVFEREDNSWIYLIESNLSNWNPSLERVFAYRSTKDLFQQWQSWLIAEEVAAGSKLMGDLALNEEETASHSAKKISKSIPARRYRELVSKALPHLRYYRTDPHNRKILFRSRNRNVDFFALSGGEREIAYLLGQIDRFNLENGVVLIDEPELHLHPQMVSDWIMFLQQEMQYGQVWLATHSYEAVEAAGLENTFVLHVDSKTRKSSVNTSVSNEEKSKELFGLLGVPGLTLHGKTLLIVEGGHAPTERNRYKQMLGGTSRFVVLPQGDNKDDVIGSVHAYRGLENISSQSIIVKGIIDSDFGSYEQRNIHDDSKQLLRLGVHEVENLFLHPATLTTIASQNGRSDFDWELSVKAQSDVLAGKWVFGRANFERHHIWKSHINDEDFHNLKRSCSKLTWEEIFEDPEWLVKLEVPDALIHFFQEAENDFRQLRDRSDWWKHLMGKEVERSILRFLDLRSTDALEASALRVWREIPKLIPDEVTAIRNFMIDE